MALIEPLRKQVEEQESYVMDSIDYCKESDLDLIKEFSIGSLDKLPSKFYYYRYDEEDDVEYTRLDEEVEFLIMLWEKLRAAELGEINSLKKHA